MALTAAEQIQIRRELQANYILLATSAQEVAGALGWDGQRLQDTLGLVEGRAEAVDVWRLRDYLDQATRAHGKDPVPHTVLTERARSMAQTWFPLHPPA